MRNVERTSEPRSLRDYANSWKRELLNEIVSKGDVSLVNDNFFNKYNQPDVKEALNNMYDGFCCYCEGKTGKVDFPHIEHRKPKKQFPENTFDWNNLHLSCEVCN